MASVGVSKLIPFSEGFACAKSSDSPRQQAGAPQTTAAAFLYTTDSMVCSQGISGSSKPRDTAVTTSLELVSGGWKADRRYRVMIMQLSRRVWVRIT